MLKPQRDSSALAHLTLSIKEKAGLKNIQPSDCRWLSHAVMEKTGLHVSETTLKRLFGFAASQYQLSAFTKNALAMYLEFPNWEDFIAKQTLINYENTNSENIYWEQLQKRSRKISMYTFQVLKNRSGIPFEATIDRRFAETHIRYFLESDCLATSFVAPGGYGKSILLTRIAYKFWLSDNPVFRNDVVWFVSGQTLGGLLNEGFDLDAWFLQQVGLVEEVNLMKYFEKNQERIRGRLIMILDGFDEIMQKDAQIHSFFNRIIGFITANSQNKWIKIILSVRSYTWENILANTEYSNFIRKHWHLGASYRSANLVNVPLLKDTEVMSILNNLYNGRMQSEGMQQDILSQLANPFYIQLLYQLKKINPKEGRQKAVFNYFDLVSEFILKKIYQTRYSSEKVSIIKRFLEHMNSSTSVDYIDKEKLIPDSIDFHKAYHELLSYGVLAESQGKRFGIKKSVYFNHINLLEYFLSMEMLTLHNYVISFEILKQVDQTFSGNKYRIPILKWLIYYAVTNNQFQGLEKIRDLNISPHDKEQLYIFFAELLKKKYLNEQGAKNEEIRSLLPQGKFYFSSFIELGFHSFNYEKALEIFAELATEPSEKISLHASLAYKALSKLNSKRMGIQIGYLEHLKPSCSHDFGLEPYILLKAIFTFYTTHQIDEECVQKMLNYVRSYPVGDEISKRNPYLRLVHSIIITHLKIIDNTAISLEVLNRFYPQPFKALLRLRKYPIPFIYLILYAQVSIKNKDVEKAKRIISFISNYIHSHPIDYYGSFFRVFYEQLQVQLALFNHDLETALLYQQTIAELCFQEDLNLLRLFSESIFINYYHENKLFKEEKELLLLLKADVPSSEFKMEALIGYY